MTRCRDAGRHARPLPPHPAVRRARTSRRPGGSSSCCRASGSLASPSARATARMQRFARRFHVLAVDLGGLMIKVGQFMSSRLDVLPPEITNELEGLQDEVPAVPFAAHPRARRGRARHAARRAPTRGSTRRRWPRHPSVRRTAPASSPVDAADTGLDDVVVKVQRPGIDEIVAVDLAALRRVGGWLSRVRLVSDRVDAPALVEEFAATSLEEIDYLHEAASAERFARGLRRRPARRRARGRVGAHDPPRADARGRHGDQDQRRRRRCAPPASTRPRSPRVFAAVMFDQMFIARLLPRRPAPRQHLRDAASGRRRIGELAAWTLTFIDFGMMGEVPDSLRAGLRKLLIAVAVARRPRPGRRDPRASACCCLGRHRRARARDDRAVRPVRRHGLRRAAARSTRASSATSPTSSATWCASLPFQLPENFLLLIRAISLTSGVCSALDPDVQHVGCRRALRGAALCATSAATSSRPSAKRSLSIAGLAARLPRRLDELVTRVQDGEIAVDTPRLDRRIARLERTIRRVVSAVLFAGLFIGGAVLRPEDAVFGTVLMVGSAVPLLHALLAGVRRGPGAG